MSSPEAIVRVDRLRARGAAALRGCGPCTACCTVMAVTELNKPMRRACDHVGRDGCRIHPERPSSCREFHCLWLRGAVGDGDETRPDALGVMFDHFTTRGTDDQHTLAFELWPGALESPAAAALLDALAASRVVHVSRRDGTITPLGPLSPP